MLTPDEQTCESCMYWRPLSGPNGQPDEYGEFSGQCRRYPPVLTGPDEDMYDDNRKWLGRSIHDVISWTQPITDCLQWCGEWRMKPAIEENQ